MRTCLLSGSLVLLLFTQCKSGLVTMSNGCYDLINQGQALNKEGNYSAALDIFDRVLQKCDAYDAKDKAYSGKAAALNGLQRYSEALDAAGTGLAANKSSLENLLEKANAEAGLGDYQDARADVNSMIVLTEKNRNAAQRAALYAKLAEMDTRLQQFDLALQDMQRAMALENGNPRWDMQQGDINVAAGRYSAAISNYDDAIAKGKNDAEAWKARTTTLVRAYQTKYGVTDAGMLIKKISAADRKALCSSIADARRAGVQDMGIDLLFLRACN